MLGNNADVQTMVSHVSVEPLTPPPKLMFHFSLIQVSTTDAAEAPVATPARSETQVPNIQPEKLNEPTPPPPTPAAQDHSNGVIENEPAQPAPRAEPQPPHPQPELALQVAPFDRKAIG